MVAVVAVMVGVAVLAGVVVMVGVVVPGVGGRLGSEGGSSGVKGAKQEVRDMLPNAKGALSRIQLGALR